MSHAEREHHGERAPTSVRGRLSQLLTHFCRSPADHLLVTALLQLPRKCPHKSASIQESPLHSSSPQRGMTTGISKPALFWVPVGVPNEIQRKRRCLALPAALPSVQMMGSRYNIPQKRRLESLSATLPTAPWKIYFEEVPPKRRCLALPAALPSVQMMGISDKMLLKRRRETLPATPPTAPRKRYADEIPPKRRREAPLGIPSTPRTSIPGEIPPKLRCAFLLCAPTNAAITGLPVKVPPKRRCMDPLATPITNNPEETPSKRRRVAFLDTPPAPEAQPYESNSLQNGATVKAPEETWRLRQCEQTSFQERQPEGCFPADKSAEDASEDDAQYLVHPYQRPECACRHMALKCESLRGERDSWMRETYGHVLSAMQVRRAARRFR